MKPILLIIAVLAMSTPAVGQVDESEDSGFQIVTRPEDYNQKWALIVGLNYESQGEEWKLKNPESDAIAIYAELKENKGFECQLLTGKEASRANILGALAKLQDRVGEDDCFLFYFAGHGNTAEACPVLYPTDFEVNGAIVNAIRADEIVNERLKARHSLYVFDSCYSGKIVDIPYKNLKRRQSDPTFDGRSVQVLTAATDNQKAKDGDNQHSPFASAFLDAFEYEKRISATAVHQKISDRLRGQNAVFESFVPGRDVVAAGEFYFTGKPRIPQTRTITYQTLGGSHGTLAGSPLSRSWFEETPWLIPALRLVLDDDTLGTPRLYPSATSADPVDAHPASMRRLVDEAQSWLDSEPSIDASVLELYKALKGLPKAKNKRTVIESALRAMSARNADVSPTDLHTMAILECANLRYDADSPSGDATSRIEELFAKATAAYERDKRVGLQVRCLADHANWLLETEAYDEANKSYRQAIALVDGLKDAGRLRAELFAGAAYSSRRLAKQWLTRKDAVSADDRIVAQQLWSDAKSYYDELDKCIDGIGSAEAHLSRAYLHERLAWLDMDLWNLTEAKQHFTEAVALREQSEMDLVSFLCYANSKQGIAMIEQMIGSSGKEGLIATQRLVEQRLEQATDDPNTRSVLYSRLCNTIERLGDCDFVAGREQLLASIGTYRTGIDVCDDWLHTATTVGERETTSARTQRLRFLCKTVIAAAADNRSDLCSEVFPELKHERERSEVNSGVLLVLCEFAEAFAHYCGSRTTCEGKRGCQSAIDAIRTVIHQHSAASLDRETAEILLMASGIVATEQQRQDAIVLRKLLPTDTSGNPPTQMSRNVRGQYDRVVVLQGGSYAGQVEWKEFQRFRDLILSLQGDVWTRSEKDGPHVLFYFPVDGSHGLVILSNGLEEGTDEVYEIDFGWNAIGELNPGLKEKMGRLLRQYEKTKIGWANDKMLNDAGFSVRQCPFVN